MEKFNYFNPSRYTLSQNWKNAIQALINTQDTLSALSTQIKNKDVVSEIQLVIREIGQKLKESTNEQLKGGVLVELTKKVSKIINGAYFKKILEIEDMDSYQITQIIKRINDFTTQAFDSIQAASEEKLDVKSILNHPISKTVFGAAASPAIMNSVFGAFAPVAGVAGGAALKIADRMGMNKYLGELSPFKKNLTEQTKAGATGGTAGAASSNGGFSGSPGGTGVGGESGAISNELFTFYNTGALKANWTKQVLALLKGNPQIKEEDEKSGGFFNNLKSKFTGILDLVKGKIMGVFGGISTFFGSIFSKLGGMFGNIASKAGGLLGGIGSKIGGFLGADAGSAAAGGLLGSAAAIGGAGLAGWGAGRWIGKNLGVDKALSGAGGLFTNMFTDKKAMSALNKQNAANRARAGMSPTGTSATGTKKSIFDDKEAMAMSTGGANTVYGQNISDMRKEDIANDRYAGFGTKGKIASTQIQKPVVANYNEDYNKKMADYYNKSINTDKHLASSKATVDAINKVGDKIEKAQEKKQTGGSTGSYLRKNIEDPLLDLLGMGNLTLDN